MAVALLKGYKGLALLKQGTMHCTAFLLAVFGTILEAHNNHQGGMVVSPLSTRLR